MRAVVDSYLLTPIQQGMLFHHLQGANVGVDVEQMVGNLHEAVDVEVLRHAWQRIADQHPILRTRFKWTGADEPLQEVVDSIEVALDVHDLGGLSPEEQEARLASFMTDDRRRGFDLAVAPMWRITLFRLGDTSQRFVFTYHHSLLDISVVWVVEEAFQTYDAALRGEVAPLEQRRPFRDHVEWLHEHLRTDRDAAQAYYRQLLAGYDEPISLVALERGAPTGVADSIDAADVVYGHDRFPLGADLSGAMHAFAQSYRVGPPVLIETAWALVLAAFSGSTDIVFGSTRGCRRTGLPGSDRTIGLFINTPPVRVVIDPAATVADLLGAVRAQQVEKRAHEHTALTDIQAVSDVHGAPLFETICVINELHQGTRLKLVGPAFEHREFDLHDQTNFPLTLLAFTDPLIHCKLSYDPRRFDAESIGRVRDLFIAVLEAIVAAPDAPVGSLPRVSARERELLAAWNSTGRDFPGAATLPELFEAQVDRTPDATALVVQSQRLTYRELDRRANAVAATLRGLGVGPDSMVGVFMDRSVEMVVSLLGILKAGGAYVPMDPAYPAVRIAMMLEDSHADVVLTERRLRDAVPDTVPHVVTVDQFDGRAEDRAPLAAAAALSSNHLAYVIFTSGSTGRPKGVMIEHRNVVNFLTAMDDVLGHDATQAPGVWLAVTSISFDISVLELFWTLTRGFTLVLQQDDGRLTDGSTAGSSRGDAAVSAMQFSLFYFAADATSVAGDRYRLLLEGAKFADANGFSAIWTPERHFHEFGGNYPNAAITSTAVAMVTERIQIRAGSVVLPLHNPIRCAEDWSVVDNLSNGRVGLSFASGWHANDFVLAPDNFADRRALMASGIDTIRSLWRGESVTATSGDGREVSVSMFPPPVQPDPPIWITAGGSPDTFAMAGRIGASILTNLLVMNHDDLVANIAAYRAAYAAAGHPGKGHISLMLHTFVGDDIDDVRDTVREPFLEYLRTSTDLINQVRWEQTSFAKPTAQRTQPGEAQDLSELSAEEMAVIMDHAFDRYFRTAGLFGTPESCRETVQRLADLGVDELACLIDFGVDEQRVLDGLRQLDALRRLTNPEPGADDAAAVDPAGDGVAPAGDDWGLIAQFERHEVTHFQCTPSHAAVIAATPEGMTALARLRKLLLGGEALPAALADRIRPQIRGDLLNMYGPTETTIWSTVSPILAAGRPITIGRPIANTEIHIVDRHLQPNPIGVAGELLIGGAGVVRGYLDRPELTDERFVALPAAGGDRVYRTGDLARMRADGEIEFSGRLDHQVKIRGYRIELGEIETAIGRHGDVFETVVVARTDSPGEPRLIAYVVPRSAGEGGDTDAWGQVWNETYGQSTETDATFDIAGWNDSYTGAPIPAEEMREWVDETVARISELAPRRILEIGCGTGLLLFRLAPQAERFVGIDLAQNALDRIAQRLETAPLPQVSLLQGRADDVATLVDETFDTIVVNSVAQYFPDVDYFVDVVAKAMSLLAPGGALFLGDLRSHAHLPLFAAAVELARAPSEMTRADLYERAEQRALHDEELVIDPALFLALRSAVPALASVDVRLKAGRFHNELTRFRYDVVLRREGGAEATDVPVRTLPLAEFSVDAVRTALADEPPILVVPSLRNDRLVREAALVEVLSDANGPATVADIQQALEHVEPGVDPADLVDLDPRYHTDLVWSADGCDRFDLVLRSRNQPSRQPTVFTDAPPHWSVFANEPAQPAAKDLGPTLRAHVRASLPDYMVPTAFVVLQALPRTPNGKIDRNALPAPDRSRTEGSVAAAPPANDFERSIATVWQDMLSLDAVGVETNVFDLGANSLMMVQASARLSELLSRKVSLVDMFRFPTVRSLAGFLGDDGSDGPDDVQESLERGQSRKDAMQRRRDARQRPKPDRRP